MASAAPILAIRDLHAHLDLPTGVVHAVNGVDLEVGRNETLGLVGESGCGKSMTALSILRLLPESGRIVSGQILFMGRDLLELSEGEMRKVRGTQIGTILQASASSLNPCLTIGDQVQETLSRTPGGQRLNQLALNLLQMVRLSDPKLRFRQYPHQLSGGMKQRVGGAIALGGRPSLVIADEPTTALDATVQLEYLELVQDLQRQLEFALLLITHDFGVVAKMCDSVAVMYAGTVVEHGRTSEVLENPSHPYTEALLKAVPSLDQGEDLLATIPGSPPDGLEPISACPFASRCGYVKDVCRVSPPPVVETAPGHTGRCWKPVGYSL